MPQPWILRLILNAAAFEAARPYVYMYICIYVHIHKRARARAHTHTHTHTHTQLYIYRQHAGYGTAGVGGGFQSPGLLATKDLSERGGEGGGTSRAGSPGTRSPRRQVGKDLRFDAVERASSPLQGI